jgi:chromatin segregation and condensation protein Rec8/ScpA/Scc1 (kleisin family)
MPLRFRVEETMRELYLRVDREQIVPLLRHLNTREDVEEVVVLIVAVLELARLGGVVAEQRGPFTEIYLRRGGREVDLSTLAGAGG